VTGALAPGELAGLTREQRALLFEQLRRRKEPAAGQARIQRRDPDLAAVPLSFPQERFWFLDRLQPGSPAYNIPFAMALRGALDPAVLEAALNEVARRHEALRTVFRDADRQPRQVVLPHERRALPVVDLSALPDGERTATARRLAFEEGQRPFDLERGPLLRTVLLRCGPAEHALLLNLHHIVSDGWSLGVLTKELGALHEAARRGRPSPLPEPPLQYADFAVWQRAWLQGEVLERQLGYWRGRLAGAAVLDLPTDRPRPPVRSFRGASRLFAVGSETSQALQALARRHDATAFMVLLAAFQAVLGRAAGQEDVVVGSPIANRNRAETEPLIGPFVNTLALRGDLSGDPPFGELIARARGSAVEAFTHQDLPFERLVEELQPERRLSQNPLFQVVFAVQDPPLRGLELPGLALSQIEFENPVARFDLELLWAENDGGSAGQIIYSTDLFDPATVLRLWQRLEMLLAAAAASPATRLSEIPACREPECHQLLAEWNDTAADLPPGTLASLFAEQARLRPDAVAVSSDEGDLTYAELDRRADRLARRLAAAAVGSEVRVALLARRSLALVVGIVGIVKAGGAYVPLDPSYPAERLAWMLQDSAARVLLSETELIPEGFATLEVLELTADPGRSGGRDPAGPLPGGLAYVMYTSGSTGRPKGVGVTHRNVVRLVREGGFADLGPDQVFLQLAPVSFDASTLEIWAPLLNGGRLAVLPPRRPSLEELGEAVSRFGVTTLWLTAGLFQQMVDHRLADLRPLRQLLAGGDVLSPAHVRRALTGLPDGTLINGYGPTEATTFTCCAALTEQAPTVPIGRPIGNTRVFVLGPDLRPAPGGAWGELFAAGDGISRGYLGSPELTAERFVPDPFAALGGAGSRLYRTGDVVRCRADGRIEFRGRRDGQVKLRGFRVELGEIESALARHPEVREAAVAARPTGGAAGPRLVAWVVPRTSPPGELVPELRRFLAATLPEYMLPSAFVLLGALPLTANGKVDRAALPEPEDPAGAETWIAPATPLEELLAAVTAEILDVERVGMGDNFFELGGHSLLATRLVSRLAQDHGLPITLQMVFDSPTFAHLADRLVQQELADASDELLAEVLSEVEEGR
jgi:amino acid adenylation domain-containing protein